MKVLSIKQPWAYLIASGIKDIENRTWKCPEKYIGKRVLIHASAKPVSNGKCISHFFNEEQYRHIAFTTHPNKQLDTWFLKELSHVTFAQIMNYLRQENIAFEVITFSKYSDEKGIRCVDSCVTFDFVDEYCTVERTKRKKVKTVKELKVTHQDDFVLNGIRLWKYES